MVGRPPAVVCVRAPAGTFHFTTAEDHPLGSKVTMFAPCSILSETVPVPVPTPAPRYGQHSRQVLRDVLEFDDTEVRGRTDGDGGAGVVACLRACRTCVRAVRACCACVRAYVRASCAAMLLLDQLLVSSMGDESACVLPGRCLAVVLWPVSAKHLRCFFACLLGRVINRLIGWLAVGLAMPAWQIQALVDAGVVADGWAKDDYIPVGNPWANVTSEYEAMIRRIESLSDGSGTAATPRARL